MNIKFYTRGISQFSFQSIACPTFEAVCCLQKAQNQVFGSLSAASCFWVSSVKLLKRFQIDTRPDGLPVYTIPSQVYFICYFLKRASHYLPRVIKSSA